MTTTVTVAGHGFMAGSKRSVRTDHRTYWIHGGETLQDEITKRVSTLIHQQFAANVTAGVINRELVDAAMRVQRQMDTYWRVARLTYRDGQVSYDAEGDVDLHDLATAIEDFLADLPNMVSAALRR